MDLENGAGKRTASFLWDGNTYNLEADVMEDWFDCNVANQLNELIIAKGTGKQLFFASDGYQECIVFYCDKEWANAFQEKTGLRLAERM